MNSFNGFRLLMIFVIRLCIIVMTIESYCCRHFHVKIQRNLHEIDCIFAQKLKLQINYRQLKRTVLVAFAKWMSVYVIVASIFIANNLMVNATNPKYIQLMLSVYSMLKKALFGCTYITCAILIKYRIQAMCRVLDGNLLLLTKSTFELLLIDRESQGDRETFEFQRLIHLWQMFPRIHETIQLMNDTFKWSISIAFFANLFDVSAMIFYNLDKAFGSEESDCRSTTELTYFITAGIFYYAFAFATITQMANSVATEAEKIAPKIQQISSSGVASDEFQYFVSKIWTAFDLTSKRSNIEL